MHLTVQKSPPTHQRQLSFTCFKTLDSHLNRCEWHKTVCVFSVLQEVCPGNENFHRPWRKSSATTGGLDVMWGGGLVEQSVAYKALNVPFWRMSPSGIITQHPGAEYSGSKRGPWVQISWDFFEEAKSLHYAPYQAVAVATAQMLLPLSLYSCYYGRGACLQQLSSTA